MRTLKLIYKIHCSLYESITVNDKIRSKNLLLKCKYCIRRLMVLKEVTIDLCLCIYVCPLYERSKKSIDYSLFAIVRSPTLYWVSTNPGRDSVCM